MKKFLLFLFAFSYQLGLFSQILPVNTWNTAGNTFTSNVNYLGTNNNRSLFLKTNTASNVGYIKYDSLGNFIWRQNTARPESKIQFSDVINTGFGVPCVYIGVKNPTVYNYAFWSDSSITRFNGPQTIRLCSTDIPLFTGSGANPDNNNGSYITFNSINTATATLTSNKTHIFIGGCTWGFAGTPTITPIKIAITADTYSATIASTVPSAITMDVPSPIAGTNISITTNLALRATGNSNFNGNTYFGGAVSSVTTPSALVHIAAGDASTPALKFTTQTAPSSPNNGEVWFNGSTFTFQGSKTLSGNNITVGTSSVGSTFTVTGISTLNGIANTTSITTSTTFSCGSTFTASGAAKMTGIANTTSITTSTTFSAGTTATVAGGALSLTSYTASAVANAIVFGSATLDFPSTILTAVADLTLTVVGARDGDVVTVGVPNGAVTATADYWGWVSANDVVTIRFSPKATENPASGTFKATVSKN